MNDAPPSRHGADPRLADVAMPALTVEATETCQAIERLFHRRAELSCVVAEDGQRRHLLTRRRMMAEMAGPLGYGRALYSHRPIAELTDRIPTLVLPSEMDLDTAGQHALERPNPWRYDDILVDGDSDPHYVAVADLFSHLASVNERRSLVDSLTGLANRAGFARAVDEALRNAEDHATQRPAVLFVDLDDFKAVNDSLGHAVGDDVLRTLGDRMRQMFRDTDVVARLGGDEFAVLLPRADRARAEEAAERVLSIVSEPVDLGGQALPMGTSVGIALQDDKDEPVGVLLRNADLAMYEAKREGKGRRASYRDELHSKAVARLDLRTDAAGAIERGEMYAAYQPLVRLSDRRIVAAEALIRWQHPRLGAIAPFDFLPLVEQSGAIHAIGAWMMREAFAQAVRWHEEHGRPLSMSVNVAVSQLEEPGFPELVASIIQETDIQTRMIIFELTESALTRHDQRLQETLEAIQRQGIRIAVDDFGVGYSSFGRLDDLPFQELKIDRSFTSRIQPGRRHGVLQGLLGLAHAMGMEPVVEGVETEEQALVLRDLGYVVAQGYLFSPPVDADDFGRMLSGRRPAAA